MFGYGRFKTESRLAPLQMTLKDSAAVQKLAEYDESIKKYVKSNAKEFFENTKVTKEDIEIGYKGLIRQDNPTNPKFSPRHVFHPLFEPNKVAIYTMDCNENINRITEKAQRDEILAQSQASVWVFVKPMSVKTTHKSKSLANNFVISKIVYLPRRQSEPLLV